MGCCDKMKGAVKLVRSELGIGVSAPELVAERRKVCEACPEWDHGKCKRCGCYTYAKTRLTKETCPLEKW